MISPIELREWMQKNPEPAFHESKVTALLTEELSSNHSLEVFQPLDTGLLVSYQGSSLKGNTLIRSDIDALPISRDNSTALSASHLCGHDIHTSILWGIIQKVIKNSPHRNFLFLFQPGEESGDGARRIIQSHILDQWSIDHCFALHVHDAYPLGTIATNNTTLFAASQEIDIFFEGVQGHITCPDKGIDAWKACVQFANQWNQTESSHDAFLGIGRVISGITRNSIPAEAKMYLTTRACTIEKLNTIHHQIETIVRGIEKQKGARGTIVKGSSCPPVQNYPDLYVKSYAKLDTLFSMINTDMVWAAEDFGYFSSRFPSFMFWLGVREEDAVEVGLHHPNFHPPNEAIQLGIQAFSVLLDI